jgi:hypothetical protein
MSTPAASADVARATESAALASNGFANFILIFLHVDRSDTGLILLRFVVSTGMLRLD